MLKKWAACALLVSSVCMPAFAQGEYPCCDCGCGPRPARITLRHIEGKGVGYNRGYTTLEGFFPYVGESWVPFLDVRGHVFNNHHHHHHNHWAANGGLGLRYVGNRVWGVNGYYDYRHTHHHHYHQGGAGLESLGQVLDFRINGYWPFGSTESHRFDVGSPSFDHFEGNFAILRQSGKREFAMRGANAEIGAHVNAIDCAPLYFAAGPYYWNGHGKHAWGGEARVAMDYMEYLRLELSGSYDRIFRGIVQGQLSINIPLGSRRQIVDSCCDRAIALARRAVQRVDRSEIIVVDTKHDHFTSVAINPETNSEWIFWFVDNTSSSAGTFEDPFPTLLEAQNASGPNDVIYVFPGDGTSTGMDTGIVLQDGQKFWGAGLNQTLPTTDGTVIIPPQAVGLPVITNSGNVVIAANRNEISGFEIQVPDGNDGVTANNVSDLDVHRNLFVLMDTSSYGVDLSGVVGANIHLNLFRNENQTDGAANFGVNASDSSDLLIVNNVFMMTSDDGAAVRLLDSANVNILENVVQVAGNDNAGVRADTVTDLTIDSNLIQVMETVAGGAGSQGISLDTVGGQMAITNNIIEVSDLVGAPAQTAAILVDDLPAGSSYLIDSNILSATSGLNNETGIQLGTAGLTLSDTMLITNNVFNDFGTATTAGHALFAPNLDGNGTLVISDNLFDGTSGILGSVAVRVAATGDIQLRVLDNLWVNSTSQLVPSLYVSNTATSVSCITLTDNVSDVLTGNPAYRFINPVGGVMTLDASGNVGDIDADPTVTLGSCP